MKLHTAEEIIEYYTMGHWTKRQDKFISLSSHEKIVEELKKEINDLKIKVDFEVDQQHNIKQQLKEANQRVDDEQMSKFEVLEKLKAVLSELKTLAGETK